MNFTAVLSLLFAEWVILILWTGTVRSQNVNLSILLPSVTTNTSIILPSTTATSEERDTTTATQANVSTTTYPKDQQTQTTPVWTDNVTSTSNGSVEQNSARPFDNNDCRVSPIPEEQYKEECCRRHYSAYAYRWINGAYYLTTILERMQRWGCKQFENECKRPTWPFTEYTSLTYDLFCNRTILEHRCQAKITEVVKRYDFLKAGNINQFSRASWKVLIEALDSSQMEWRDLNEPCVQVALFDRSDGGVGRFHEIVEPFAPFCGLQWKGYDYNTANYRRVSPWTGLSLWCRSSIIICMVVIAVGGFTTIVANIIILCVFGTTERLRNSQAVYKMSLAAADLMVGVIIWPNMIVMQYLSFMQPRGMGPVVRKPYISNESMVPFDNQNLTYRYAGGTFRSAFPREYVLAIGFFTLLGLMVSIYTLMIASFDRFLAVYKPLRYNRFNAKRQAKIACAVLWGVSVVVSLIPTFIPDRQYQYHVMSSIFINIEGEFALIILFLALFLPLIVTWVVTVLTFRMSRMHARSRQKIVSANAKSSIALERRLAKTLALMVGVFTLAILPAICCIIAGFSSPSTIWQDPLNLSVTAANAYTTSEYISIIILTSNSLWNCFIYSLRTRGFRDAVNSIIKNLSEMAGAQYIRRQAMHVVHGARRVSLSTMMNMRRFSTPETSDSRKKSVTSLNTGLSKISEISSSSTGRPSVDMGLSSTLGHSTASNDITSVYAKSTSKGGKTTSGVEIRAERKKQLKKEEDAYVGDDSTFGSFAVPAGADRLFESVMENVPEVEEIQIDEDTKQEKNDTR